MQSCSKYQEICASESDPGMLAMAVQQATDSIIIMDTEGIIEYVNPSFEQVTGFSRNEAVGKSIRCFHSGKESYDFYDKIREMYY